MSAAERRFSTKRDYRTSYAGPEAAFSTKRDSHPRTPARQQRFSTTPNFRTPYAGPNSPHPPPRR